MENKFLLRLKKAKRAQVLLASSDSGVRNGIVKGIARELKRSASRIVRANRKDLKLLKPSEPMFDRLKLDEKRIDALAGSLAKIAALPDPLGKILYRYRMPNGLLVTRVTVPIGVIGVIYESRPDVTIDLAALGLKSGNALVLKGGKESFNTNIQLIKIIQKVLSRHKLPKDLAYLVKNRDPWKEKLLSAYEYVDVLIPRGGQGLINFVRKASEIPVIETGAGVCHTFVDLGADVTKATKIIINAKTQRSSVCNALDTLVVHKDISDRLFEKLASALSSATVKIYADKRSYRILQDKYPQSLLFQARAENYGREFLSMSMSIKTVDSFSQALDFIEEKTSHHSEAIITNSAHHAKIFLDKIDAAVVLHNTSTRFTDGEQFGLGAEVGISTQKLHARGPMGLEALTSYKWVVYGQGQIRR